MTETKNKGMLIGSLSEGQRYAALHPRFARVFDFLRETDLTKLATGRHEIDGSRVFVNIDEVELKPYADGGKLETHRRYIDIQIPLMETETMGFIDDPDGVNAHASEFNVEKDYLLYENPAMQPITVHKGEFVIFYPPYAAHMPCRTSGEPKRVRKAVVKVLADTAE